MAKAHTARDRSGERLINARHQRRGHHRQAPIHQLSGGCDVKLSMAIQRASGNAVLDVISQTFEGGLRQANLLEPDLGTGLAWLGTHGSGVTNRLDGPGGG